MVRPKLSICIPTRNRAAELERTIRFLLLESQFPFPIEVCISDNASVDETPRVAERLIDEGLPLRYRRNERGVPIWTNYSNAIRFGRGEFLFVMSDDDLLDVPQLAKVVEMMEADPDVAAAYAPFEYYDPAQPNKGHFSYDRSRLPERTRFSAKQPLEAIQWFLTQIVPPEVLVYRADVVATLFNNTRFCYTNIFDMCSLLLQGDVIFMRDSFYRWIQNAPATGTAPRIHAGNSEGAAGWDSWRGGVEELCLTLLSRAQIYLDENGQKTLNRMIDQYENSRMIVTLGVLLNNRDYFKAYEVYTRIKVMASRIGVDPGGYASVVIARDVLAVAAPMSFLAHVILQEQSCDRLFTVGLTEETKVIRLMLGEMDIPVAIEEYPEGTMPADLPTGPDGITRLVLVRSRADKNVWIEAGYMPGQILDLESLQKRFPI